VGTVTRTRKIVLGTATFAQVPATAALFVADLNLTLAVVVVVLQLVLLLYYLWDVGGNDLVPEGTERAWRLGILVLGVIAEPIYFWNYIWPA
jgi:hypothetical protein